MFQHRVDSARAILNTDPATALRIPVDFIRWSVDRAVRGIHHTLPSWNPSVEDVAVLIELAGAVAEILERLVADEGVTDRDEEIEDARLRALVVARNVTTSGELVDFEDLAAELGIDLNDVPEDPD